MTRVTGSLTIARPIREVFDTVADQRNEPRHNPLLAAASTAALFADRPVTDYVVLALPLGVQEIVFGIWLLVKGFSPVRLAVTGTRASTRTDVLATS